MADNNQINTKRIKLCEICIKSDEGNLHCISRLSYGKTEAITLVKCENSTSSRKKAVAQSVLNGIKKLLDLKYSITAKNVIVNTLEDMTFVSVITEIRHDKIIDKSVGSAIVKTDINEAIGKAALDAVNRKLDKCLNK